MGTHRKNVIDFVLGTKMASWQRWYDEAEAMAVRLDVTVETFITAACAAVLMEIGEPPYPQFLTSYTDAVVPHPRHRHGTAYSVYLKEREHQQKVQFAWNRKFNDWCIANNMHFNYKQHGPAQLRKYFAAWWLVHRCDKQVEGAEQELAQQQAAMESNTHVSPTSRRMPGL